MTIFHSQGTPLLHPPPEDKTLPQFLLDGVRPDAFRPDLPEYPCLIEEETGRQVYIDELRSRTENLARAFSSQDVVVLCSPNHLDYPVCIWAAHRLGSIVAPIGPSLTIEEMAHQIRIAKPALILVHSEALSVALAATNLSNSRIVVIDASSTLDTSKFRTLEGIIAEGAHLPPFQEFNLKAGEAKTKIAVLIFSSGTTGIPKAVSVTHYNLVSFLLQSCAFFKLFDPKTRWEDRRYRPGDVVSGALPLYHIYGLAGNMVTIYTRMGQVVSPKFVFDKFLNSIARYRVTHLLIVPPQAILLTKHLLSRTANLTSIRYCMIAAAPVSPELTQQLLDRMPGIELGQGYGLTETCAAISAFPVTQRVGTLGSAGQLLSGSVAKVVKSDGTLAKAGERGELYLRGGQVALGYYDNVEATEESFQDGWLKTGDEVIIDTNGDLFVLDRIKELIKVKGNQVAPAELEGLLLKSPDVSDAAVVGIPNDFAGEVPLAFVVLAPGKLDKDRRNEKTVRRAIFEATKSRYKWLTGGIVFVPSIPKNASGKILRRVLREEAKTLDLSGSQVLDFPSSKL
ncbi:phenylacetyl-CoA ligase [Mycena floridula]|nr:phenylacetyl-CoA ligase [Mycena floridula]